MQTIFSILATLFFSSIEAPPVTVDGTILYKSEIITSDERFADLKTSDPQRYREYIVFSKKINEAVEQLEYTLVFNEKAALFKAEEILGKDSDMAGSLQESIGVYYNNINEERIQQLTDQGRIFLIEREPLQWEITGETKRIAGYTCRRAVSTQNFYRHRTNENEVQEIEAWFSPDIPASFGPKGYSGLPGLILDLTVAQEHIYATEIKLKNGGREIKRPVKGKIVSFAEYQAIRAGLGEKFREFHGN